MTTQYLRPGRYAFRTLTGTLGLGLGLLGIAYGAPPAPATPGHGLNLLRLARMELGAKPQKLDIRAHFLARPVGSKREQQGQLEIKLLLPNLYQRKMQTQMRFGSFGLVQTLNGQQAWMHRVMPVGGPGFFIRGGPGGRKPTAAQRAHMQARMLSTLQQQFARAQIVWLMRLPQGFTAHYGGIAQAANGAKADWLRLGGGNGFSALLFLDPKTRRPLMMQYRGPVPRMPRNFHPPGGPGAGRPATRRGPMRRRFIMHSKPQTIELHFSHWRKVQGHWFPMRLVKTSHGAVFEQLDIKKIQLDSPKLTAKQFAKH